MIAFNFPMHFLIGDTVVISHIINLAINSVVTFKIIVSIDYRNMLER